MGKSAQYLDGNHVVVAPLPEFGADPLLHSQLEDTVRDLRRTELVQPGPG